MGHSSLLGVDQAPAESAGRDTAALGPSDSSDSGSDLVGLEDFDTDDPTLPVDVALNEDSQHALIPADTLHGAPSDAAGTGERRSAGSDAGRREAADISVDRVFGPDELEQDDEETIEEDEEEDADLAAVDSASIDDPLSEELPEDVERGDGPDNPDAV